MRALRNSIAFIAGAWLYYTAVVFFGGVLAALAIPRSYFAFFGREHNEMALALLSLLGWAAPVTVLVTGGVLALHRFLSAAGQPILRPALAGMVASFCYWAMVSVGFFSPLRSPAVGLGEVIAATFTVPWWVAPNFVAPWLGVAVAAWLLHRAQPPVAPSEA